MQAVLFENKSTRLYFLVLCNNRKFIVVNHFAGDCFAIILLPQRLALLIAQLHAHEQLKDDEFRALVGHGIGQFLHQLQGNREFEPADIEKRQSVINAIRGLLLRLESYPRVWSTSLHHESFSEPPGRTLFSRARLFARSKQQLQNH